MSVEISVVTPALDQVTSIGATIDSVLYGMTAPHEYVIVDGGSTDGTTDEIEKRASSLSWWVSERDAGQYAAINKGFRRTTGDVMAWLNAGDLYMPWTLNVVAELFDGLPDLQWLTTQRPMISDDAGRIVACEFVGGFARASFRARVNLPGGSWFARAGIQQESTFWRRSLWERVGGQVDEALQFAGDFDLWLRFFRHAQPLSVDTPLAAHRVHRGQKTETLDAYVAEAAAVLARDGFREPSRAASATRRAVYSALGRRPLRRLPAARVLAASRFLHRTQTIVWRDGRWATAEDYAV